MSVPGVAGDPGTDLLHHGDVEVRGAGLLDLAVNVHPHGPPRWLAQALRDSVEDVAAYPDARAAEVALARNHGRDPREVLATAGATEAFTLLARMRPWRRPVVVHPQFTEPHAALEQAGHRVEVVLTSGDHRLATAAVPEDADLVVLGNPTNPTGVLHPREDVLALTRPGRLVVVDEAFMDALPGEPSSLAGSPVEGVVVVRSLTKTWAIPGVRAGYLLGGPDDVDTLRAARPPWSFSAAACAAVLAISTPQGAAEQARRATELSDWSASMATQLRARGVEVVAGSAPFLLARLGEGTHRRLREVGVASRRCDTFPGLDDGWVRLAARPPATVAVLLRALEACGMRGCGP
ncbi:Rv2231c family pyridoxal phosphate-dependent protein CobC [Nocardioides sp. BSK12Z-4]|uniref:Rv2231c family pyridoxal phosphate-dependent protein CobC n=1 Tax=Nocardioides bruguierae TaxID=2945102 RepID=A0A9X2D8K5_9ACTN|nr:Rv2231c family pyridoxal phosphate-dependent protein CobC [Nocardioides bruguierae]MCL8026937.1 Rv2231c family pyridoxal phosphate-dependent protein CobC [Nocardioides bruguierae]MCM0621358.1 Rv2231c family pyridoxal phosphate-dependent protein CobC [Nocardioides bruguierae]